MYLELMHIQIETLYRLDAHGRLLCVNEPGNPPAPRFFMGRTPHGNLWRFRHDLPAELVAELDRLCMAEPVGADLVDVPAGYVAIHELLEAHAEFEDEWRGPCYLLPETSPATSRTTLITDANVELLLPDFAGLARSLNDVTVVVEHQRAVAACWCSRSGSQAAEAGVETLPGFQRHGYATAVVGAWAAAIRQQGRMPLYSTSWENQASQAVARRLGGLLYGEDWSIE